MCVTEAVLIQPTNPFYSPSLLRSFSLSLPPPTIFLHPSSFSFFPSILLIHHSLYDLRSLSLFLCRLSCILPGLCRSRVLRLCTVCKARGSAPASECTCSLWHVFIFLSVTTLPWLRSNLQRQVHQAKALISYMILTRMLELLLLKRPVKPHR